jgi:hypothetical protein
MKFLISLLLSASAACAQFTNKEFMLDALQVVRIPVTQDRLTTVRFPSSISDLQGVYFSSSPDTTARFQLSFAPGSAFFSLRALATNTTATLVVGWNGNTYHLECVQSPVSWPGVFFVEKPTLPAAPPLALPATNPPPVTLAISPNRLRDIVETAQLYDNLQKLKPPLRLRDVQRLVRYRHFAYPDCDIVLSKIFHFNADDTLVFEITIFNRTRWPLYYTPHELAMRLGNRQCGTSVFIADGMVPASASSTIYFGITGGVRGAPRGLSPDQEFEIQLERTGPAASILPSQTFGPPYALPYR